MRKAFIVMAVFIVLIPLAIKVAKAQHSVITYYEDPAGRFSAPVVHTWADESAGDVGRFVISDGLTVSLLALEASDAASGDQAVFAAVAPDLAGTDPVQTDLLPLPSATWMQTLYVPAPDRAAALITQWVDGTTYALLFESDNPDELVSLLQRKLSVGMLILYSVGERFDLSDVQPRTLTDADFADLEAFVEQARERFHVPGVAVAIVQNGQIIYTGGFGTTEMDGGQPITPETMFMVGSATKSMTSMTMATLVDDGTLEWDQPVTDVLPSFALSDPAVTAQTRMRDLLNLSMGVPSYDDILALVDFNPQELIASLADIPLVSAPGEAWNYSNQMVAAGGYISALATGAPENALYEGYTDLVQTRVFDPIGMTSTTFDQDAATAGDNVALPYLYNPLTQSHTAVSLDAERLYRQVAPAGSAWSNVHDMARYLLTTSNGGVSPDGQQVVSTENLRVTQSSEVAIAGPWFGYGMGWLIDRYQGLPLVWHRGDTLGYATDMAFLPSANLGVITLSNVYAAKPFGESIREYVFELAFGLEHTSIESFAATDEAQNQAFAQMLSLIPDPFPSIDPAVVTPYVGQYESDLQVELSDGELWLNGDLFHASLYPADGIPGMEPGDYISVHGFDAFGIRFAETDGQLALNFINLSTGAVLTFARLD